ncbi:hypothetical protein CAEBREN_24815 [Caenorhabditis brenneri]|uniref:F-box domain-containing protein n=1 Tax=Caenorhabditis brenneri TaxID=135651 RepID=G0MJD5_CAEBE|nr:hypothetical protein CAEBREN_24815 [Caenorhabditis brenneri]
MGFSILKLPLLAMHAVIANIQLDEIIDFSLCSSKCKRVIKSMNKRLYKSMEVRMSSSCPAFRFMKNKENSLFSKQIDAFQLKVIFDFLLDLFNNIPISLRSSMINQNPLNITPEYFGLKKCSSVFYLFQRMPIPDHELHYLFENIQVSEDMTINGEVSDEFRLNTAKFSTNELNIRPAHWITRDIFLSLNCSRMCLDYVSLTMNDFQSFVFQWLDSENTSFVWLQMSFTGNHEPIDFSQFQTQKFDPKVRERYYDLSYSIFSRGREIDCLDGRDIRRKDGRLGTIGYFRRKYYFVVWNQTS